MHSNYATVTELPGHRATKEQLERIYQRYFFASQFCKNKDVLEVACGAGIGLGLLEDTAGTVVGGDIDGKLLERAQKRHKDRKNIQLSQLNAQQLPFKDESFDVVILYEAIYYLKQPDRFLEDACRVLRKNGTLLICTVNKEWPDFNPSPFSLKYFSASQLYDMLSQQFGDVAVYGAFPVVMDSAKAKITSLIKRLTVKLNLVPKTMQGKELLKRIFFGKLITIPAEIKTDITQYQEPVCLSSLFHLPQYKILYALGRIS